MINKKMLLGICLTGLATISLILNLTGETSTLFTLHSDYVGSTSLGFLDIPKFFWMGFEMVFFGFGVCILIITASQKNKWLEKKLDNLEKILDEVFKDDTKC